MGSLVVTIQNNWGDAWDSTGDDMTMSNLVGEEVKVGTYVIGTVSEATFKKDGGVAIKIDFAPGMEIRYEPIIAKQLNPYPVPTWVLETKAPVMSPCDPNYTSQVKCGPPVTICNSDKPKGGTR